MSVCYCHLPDEELALVLILSLEILEYLLLILDVWKLEYWVLILGLGLLE